MQRKKVSKAYTLPEKFPCGEVLLQTQPTERKWQLGEVIGQGGFGLVYTAFDMTDGPSCLPSPYVIKMEPLGNGPLFCEFHFYQRAARPELIAQWTLSRKLRYLGIPQFLGSGQHRKGGRQFRFLVLQRLSLDLQTVFEKNCRSLPERAVLAVGLRMLDALEYIHDRGYCHADVKAANILLGFSNGSTDYNQVYLVDYGLVSSYLVDDQHREYKEDPKRAHDGTTEYASRDAHNGAHASRRGDVEMLGYCMLEWLTGSLPWHTALANKDRVRDLKTQHMKNIPGFLKACFRTKQSPAGIRRYLEHVGQLAYSAKPNYHHLRQCLSSGLDDEWALGIKPVNDASLHARGVKRKKDTADLSSPQQHKVRPGCYSPVPKPASFQRPPPTISPSSSSSSPAPPTPARHPGRVSKTYPKTPPSVRGPKTPASALTISQQSKQPVSKSKGGAKCSAGPRKAGVSTSRLHLKTSVGSEKGQRPDRVCLQEVSSYQDESGDGWFGDQDEGYCPEPDTREEERDAQDWADSDLHEPEHTYPQQNGSSWGCSIL